MTLAWHARGSGFDSRRVHMVYPVHFSGKGFEVTLDISRIIYTSGDRRVEFFYTADGIRFLGHRTAIDGFYNFLECHPEFCQTETPLYTPLDETDEKDADPYAKAIRISTWLGMLDPSD